MPTTEYTDREVSGQGMWLCGNSKTIACFVIIGFQLDVMNGLGINSFSIFIDPMTHFLG